MIQLIEDEQSLHRPSGVAVDKTCGIIAVADWCADKVFLFSYEGALLASADGFRCPHSILMNDSHRMLVTDCWNNQLKIFSYSHSTQSLLNAWLVTRHFEQWQLENTYLENEQLENGQLEN